MYINNSKTHSSKTLRQRAPANPEIVIVLSGKGLCISQFQESPSISQFQALPPPPGSPWANFQKSSNPGPLGGFFVSNPRMPGFPWTLNLNKYYTFSPYSRPQSLIYLLNIYKFIGRTKVYQ